MLSLVEIENALRASEAETHRHCNTRHERMRIRGLWHLWHMVKGRPSVDFEPCVSRSTDQRTQRCVERALQYLRGDRRLMTGRNWFIAPGLDEDFQAWLHWLCAGSYGRELYKTKRGWRKIQPSNAQFFLPVNAVEGGP